MPQIDLGFRPRPWQATCFSEFARFSVIVCHRRAGKTILAILRLINSALKIKREGGRFAYIAPQLKQAKGIAWDYLQQYARKIPGTVVHQAELWCQLPNGARIRLYGADNPDALRGLYFDGVVIDEVAQIKKELWGEILLPSLADRKGWALFIGTPKGINLFSELYFKAVEDPEWYANLFDCYQTGALSAKEIERVKRESTANEFRQEMLCDFSASSDNTLISIDDAMAATKRMLASSLYTFAPKLLGVDVAWQGGDRSAMFPRQGLQAFQPKVVQGLPEKTFAGIVAQKILEWKPDMTFVDTTGGYGGEVVSRLKEAGHQKVRGVVFSWKAMDDRFQNLRAEMWFKMRDWIAGGGALPALPELIAELCAPIYSHDSASNRMKLESKDDIRERIGVSPDLADALALTFAFPVAPPPPKRPEPAIPVTTWS